MCLCSEVFCGLGWRVCRVWRYFCDVVMCRLRGVAVGVVKRCEGCDGFAAAATNWAPRISRCVARGTTLDSLCKCEMGVEAVQPVARRRALFCIFCNLLMFVFDVFGAHAMLA